MFAYAGFFVYRSLDGGSSWQEVLPLHGLVGNVLAIDPSGADRIYFAGYQFVPSEDGSRRAAILFASEDGGDTWNDLTGRFPLLPPFGLGEEFSGLAIQPDRSATVYAAAAGKLYRSRNAGARWLPVEAPGQCSIGGPLVIDPVVTSTMLALGCTQDRPVATSTDRGAHWQSTAFAGEPSITSLVADPHRAETYYVAGLNVLAVTDDGGAVWKPLVAGLPAGPVILSLAADPDVPGRLVAGLEWSGLWALTRSPAGGAGVASANE